MPAAGDEPTAGTDTGKLFLVKKPSRTRDKPQPLRAVPQQDADDDELQIEAVPRVKPGHYDARCLGGTTTSRFRRQLAQLQFQLVGLHPQAGAILQAYASMTEHRKIRPAMKLARWWKYIVEASGARSDRIALRRFTDYLWRVKVKTVTQDHRQRPVAPCDQYEVIDDLLGIVSPLAPAPEKKE
jgi:hypothetical protein